jgi:hypothetical protein
MNNSIQNDNFKKTVGDFILSFSEIEFDLAVLISKLENGLNANPLIPEIIGLRLDEKINRISSLLKSEETLLKKWQKLEGKLSNCNFFRRFIAHGIVMNKTPDPSLQGLIKSSPKKGIPGFHYKEITLEDVNKNLRSLKSISNEKDGLLDFRDDIEKWIENNASV